MLQCRIDPMGHCGSSSGFGPAGLAAAARIALKPNIGRAIGCMSRRSPPHNGYRLLLGLRASCAQRRKFDHSAVQHRIIHPNARFGMDFDTRNLPGMEKQSLWDCVLWKMLSSEINQHRQAFAFNLKSTFLTCVIDSEQPRKLCNGTASGQA